ncbi:hypothetical protein NMG60_11005278 [Bertholletia excelsa]
MTEIAGLARISISGTIIRLFPGSVSMYQKRMANVISSSLSKFLRPRNNDSAVLCFPLIFPCHI